MIIEFVHFIISEYGLITLPIIVSVIGVLYSNHYARKQSKKSALLAKEANKRALEANELAREAINSNEIQFVESNRPQLTAEPYLLQNTNSYYEISKIDHSTIHATLYVAVQNKGNIIASDTIIEEATFQVAYAGSRITYVRNFYDGLGNSYPSKEEVPLSNFTLISVQPSSGYLRKLEFILNINGSDYNADQIIQMKVNLSITVNLRISCTYALIKGKQFITHSSHGITKHGISVLENRMGVYEKNIQPKVED